MPYCLKCDREVHTHVKQTYETYPVKGENVTILANVRVCDLCGSDIWDDDLDNENLKRAFAEHQHIG